MLAGSSTGAPLGPYSSHALPAIIRSSELCEQVLVVGTPARSLFRSSRSRAPKPRRPDRPPGARDATTCPDGDDSRSITGRTVGAVTRDAGAFGGCDVGGGYCEV